MKLCVMLSLLALLFLIANPVTAQAGVDAAKTPGPHIVPVDYTALYAMQEPPDYEPFEVYGWFLISVATQQTPLVMNLDLEVPPEIEQIRDVPFKETEDSKLALDIYKPREDRSPNPLVLIIHGGYWKSGDKSVHAHDQYTQLKTIWLDLSDSEAGDI